MPRQAIAVTDLDYIDDLTLQTECNHVVEEVLGRLEQGLGKLILYCNAKKCKLQVFNREMLTSMKVRGGTSL